MTRLGPVVTRGVADKGNKASAGTLPPRGAGFPDGNGPLSAFSPARRFSLF